MTKEEISKKIEELGTVNFSDMFERKCEDCIHFNPKRLKDESEHYCLLWLKCTASLGCSEYILKQQSETGDLLGEDVSR